MSIPKSPYRQPDSFQFQIRTYHLEFQFSALLSDVRCGSSTCFRGAVRSNYGGDSIAHADPWLNAKPHQFDAGRHALGAAADDSVEINGISTLKDDLREEIEEIHRETMSANR